MAVLQMQKVSICALKKERKAVLEYLQSIGIMEMTQDIEEDAAFEKMDTVSQRTSFEKAANTADQALEILQHYVPKKQSMLSSLAGKELVESDDFGKAIERREEIHRVAIRIVKSNKEIAEHQANISRLENSIEGLKPWLSLDIPMNFKGTRKTAMFIGTMPGDHSLEDLYGIIAECAPDLTGADIEIISKDRDATYLTVLCLSEEAGQVEEAIRQHGFARPSQVVTQTPVQKKESYEKQIEQLNKMIEEIQQRLIAADAYREDLRLISDYYRIRAEKYEVLGTLPQTKNTFLITGYVPKESFQDIRGILENRYGCVVDVAEIAEEEEPPVLLKNNQFSESAEPILESYALPKKGEIDPTTVMSFFYVFFFGLMLSDAAYGAIISIACFVLLKKFPRMGAMRKSIKLFFWCGLSTLLWGIMFGGYFGDVINVVSKTFFGHEVGIRAAWFVPLDDPMRLLIYSMAFGTIHLLVGLGIKGYMEIKAKKYLDAVCDVGIWYVFLIGLLLLLIPSEIFASIAGSQIVFPPAVNLLAKIMAIGGALGLLLMSGRSSKNFGLRIALGAYDIYNVTGWLSDVLSYSRLLALGLATGVIASVVNQMGSMFGDGILGAIGFILVFIVGHTLNLAINLLGAYVHTNRLQYVEFFGKFYEGGGKAFHPFKTNTKYVDFKEETNQ
ncbi:MAG: V-type ATP synthase subunit I [Hespellia sp.]|nr:V-type ATP synthase subunit I [Hespellia sp.]